MKKKVGAPRTAKPHRRKELKLPEHIAVMGEKQAERQNKSFNKHVSDLIENAEK